MLAPVKLIIAHSHPLFGSILQNILQSRADFHIVGQAATAADLVETATALQPHVVIADIALPGMEDFTALQKLAACCKEVKVIISWGYHHHEHTISAAITAICAGYIIHDAPPAEYFFAIKQVMKGKVFYCSQTEKFRNAQKKAGNSEDLLHEITSEKYFMVIYCIWIGFTSKETAIATSLTESTINTYRKRFKNIIGSRSIAALESFMKKNKIM
jgi:DNA-binding NarL/FixJ family response regulator